MVIGGNDRGAHRTEAQASERRARRPTEGPSESGSAWRDPAATTSGTVLLRSEYASPSQGRHLSEGIAGRVERISLKFQQGNREATGLRVGATGDGALDGDVLS